MSLLNHSYNIYIIWFHFKKSSFVKKQKCKLCRMSIITPQHNVGLQQPYQYTNRNNVQTEPDWKTVITFRYSDGNNVRIALFPANGSLLWRTVTRGQQCQTAAVESAVPSFSEHQSGNIQWFQESRDIHTLAPHNGQRNFRMPMKS